MKTFSFGAILSVTTGILSADMGEVHELLDYMTGDQLFTHQLPRAANECEDELRAQFPAIAAIVVEEADGPDAYMAWVELMAHVYGAHFEVAPLRSEQHTVIDPLVEMAMNYPHVKVIPVEVDGGDQL